MSFRHFSRRGSARVASSSRQQRRKVLVERLESRQLLAGDVEFIDSLPSAEEARFGSPVVTQEGREACLAFIAAAGTAEGEALPGPPEAPGPVDLSAAIVQPAGPLAQNDPFTSEITFENAGPGDATATNLTVSFDAGLAGVTWEREVIQPQAAAVPASSLDGTNGFRLQGETASQLSGSKVSGVGDINGDGIDDVAVSFAGGAGIGGGTDPDGIFVVFGTNAGFPADLNLGTLDGTNGFKLTGVGIGGFSLSVDGAGDVNGDNTQDLIIGAPGDVFSSTDGGKAFVIFGKSTFSPVLDASTLNGTDGFIVNGLNPGDTLGGSVSGAGDLNNDNIDDIIIGARGVDVPNPSGVPTDPDLQSAGEVYVIFGQNTAFGATFDLATLNGTNGFVVRGSVEGDNLGVAVSEAGDVNGDLIDDIIFTAPQGGTTTSSGLGEAFVFYGKSSGFAAAVNSSAINSTNGFKIAGIRANQEFGFEASGAADINGDGFADVIIGEGPDPGLLVGGARAYVVMGHNNTTGVFDLATLNGTNGFDVSPTAAGSPSILRVSGAGDVNGDGFADVIVGTAATTVDTTPIPGGGFVLFGKDTPFATSVNLSTLDGSNGFVIQGMNSMEQAGDAVGAAGDVNGDGKSDVIVGAPFASPGGSILAGESYVVFGRGSTITNGAGPINDTLDMLVGDQVIYRVSATIAPTATVSTTVDATATPGTGVTDTVPGNNSASATTTILASDNTAPSITNVFVAGTGWNNTFVDGVDGGGVGSGNGLGIELSAGQHIPNAGINRIYLQFSEDIGSLTSSQVELRGSAGVYGIGTVTYNPVTFLAEVPITGTIGFDKLRLSVNETVTDIAGNMLDGNGDNAPGGIFDLRFDVAPGDINGDGQVFTTDLLQWQAAFNSLPGSANYNPRADLNGDGQIFTTDLLVWQSNFNQNLANVAEPAPSSFPPPPGPPASESDAAQAIDELMGNEEGFDFNPLF